MTNIFSLKNDLWEKLIEVRPLLLTEVTQLKVTIFSEFLYGVQKEYKLCNDLTNDIESMFITKVWNYSDEENFDIPLDIIANLLIECIEIECCRYNYCDEKIKIIIDDCTAHLVRNDNLYIIIDAQIRSQIAYSYLIEQLINKGCPITLAKQIIPSSRDVERRLILDSLYLNAD